MKIKILKQEKNPFLQRDELILEITSQSAPSTLDVISELGRDAALTIIKKINTNFGRQTFLTEVVVYDNLEAREKIETIPQKIKKKIAEEKRVAEEKVKKEAKAAEEAKAEEAKAEEAKAEEAKEEKTEEAKEEKTEEAKEEKTEETKEEEKTE